MKLHNMFEVGEYHHLKNPINVLRIVKFGTKEKWKGHRQEIVFVKMVSWDA